jgi:nickel/cobalt exporter
MKKLVVVLIALAACSLALSAAAQAHPLGNFTINQYSRIQPSGDRLYVLYVLDLAEIPTFQAKPEVSAGGEDKYADGLARTIDRHLGLTVDGRRAELTPIRRVLAFPPGQAGLRTTRLQVVFQGPRLAGESTIAYRDTNFAGRIGWKEITVKPSSGADVLSANAPSRSVSSELLAYPKDLLQSPLDVTSARARVEPGSAAGAPPVLLPRNVLEQRVGVRAVADGGFASLIARDNLTPGFVALSLLIAMFWGAAHAFSPGHGKSIVAAYLVGSRGTPRHAVFLGMTVTVTHTIGVFALGLVTLSLSAFMVPDQLYPWLNLVSALLIVGVGVSVLRWRVREWRGHSRSGHHHHHDDDHHDHHHDHDHGHHHHGHADHHHGHSHDHDHALSPRRLLGIGVSGGIVPCPTALVVLLAAISLHRVGYGLVLILAFSAGLAAAMTVIGLVAVTAKRTFERVDFNGGVIRLLPAFSAVVVLGLGLAMTVRALPHLT